jgi:hypothetical protein
VDEVMEAETDVEEAGPVDSDSVSIALEGGEADGLLRGCSWRVWGEMMLVDEVLRLSPGLGLGSWEALSEGCGSGDVCCPEESDEEGRSGGSEELHLLDWDSFSWEEMITGEFEWVW